MLTGQRSLFYHYSRLSVSNYNQIWAPIAPSEKFNFWTDTNTKDTNLIWVKS